MRACVFLLYLIITLPSLSYYLKISFLMNNKLILLTHFTSQIMSTWFTIITFLFLITIDFFCPHTFPYIYIYTNKIKAYRRLKASLLFICQSLRKREAKKDLDFEDWFSNFKCSIPFMPLLLLCFDMKTFGVGIDFFKASYNISPFQNSVIQCQFC